MTVQLYLGDCLEILPTLEAGSVDAVITDPPYGIDWDTNYKRFTTGFDIDGTNHKPVHNDDVPFDPTMWLDYKYVVIWGYPFFADRLPIGTTLVWDKRFKSGNSFLSDAELGWCKSQYPRLGPHMGGYGTYIHSQTWQGCIRRMHKK